MKHPSPEARKNQAEFLRNCPPEQRAFFEQNFRVGNAAYLYHQQALILEEPTEEDFQHWLEGLPENIRRNKEAEGFEKCRTHVPFTRHVMERRDIGMDDWMKRNLSDEDYNFWQQSGQGNVPVPISDEKKGATSSNEPK
ncbi:hypothetical protein [Tunicatimonas pelagia]|uniref:hypothetical protein n=1 Tax=Tunicatimonas pelagia TaxID=931531 RepID=UPI002666B847|nr:hypothetical protein [Tunicatimonas pelagia]WKN46508.1 hypothetical protein P0M28_30625 [Tunicatimonas pelagia]